YSFLCERDLFPSTPSEEAGHKECGRTACGRSGSEGPEASGILLREEPRSGGENGAQDEGCARAPPGLGQGVKDGKQACSVKGVPPINQPAAVSRCAGGSFELIHPLGAYRMHDAPQLLD